MDEQTADFFNPPSDLPPAPAGDAPIIMPPPAGGDSDFFGGMQTEGADNGYIGEVDATDGAPAAAPGVLVLEDPSQPTGGYSSFPDEGGYSAPPDMGYSGEQEAFAAPPATMDAFGAPSDSMDAFGAPPDSMDAFAAPPVGMDAFAAPPVGMDAYAPAEPMQGDAPLPEPEPQEPAEPSPMAKWNQEWQVILKERKDAENALKAEKVEEARKEMDGFNAEREMKRESRMAKNRTAEQSKLEAMEEDLENDNSWQRVVKLVELQQDTIEGGGDISRMRDVLIMLKNDAQRAAILA
mmetsp:Transcript_15500/g.19384  ORF Transcript_15500/g.19384 Transcript_15500/m.19384 type:complete len:294 (+) Transcript_15500:165-1046(+)|eukprot:CAMPEP_0172491798 /NCGR_PEP_ID=MMETSP1066-20121228/22682_1 /TAXON_ID=671091 /ORGANISM="Coscinodiscus wailesii, Strain CCMP2513" /LENGTH=293 /DNA_ID=CAMNT_0013261029 /DNA_START=141 /DNA_END=1022 /DNA_ORIENTATION=+